MKEKYIYITRRIPDEGINMLKEKGYVVDIGDTHDAPSKKSVIKALKKKPYEALVCFLTEKIDKEIFDACPTLKIVSSFSVGFDHIDRVEAKNRGIFVTNTPNTSSLAVAEYTVASILALTTRLTEADAFVKKGKYRGWDPHLFVGSDVSGKTVGLLGLGAIGREVAKIMHGGFKSNVIYNDINRNEDFEREVGATFVSKDEVFIKSDIVSLHVPLLDSTRHLVNADTLKMMKRDSYLINTARGPVIDEKALLEALQNGVIRGAALDVYEFEPKITKGLLKLKNVILTPHIASARESVRKAMAECVAENIIKYFETGSPRDIVKI